jgi:hypothetical protein
VIGKLTLGRSFKFCGAYMLTGRDRVHPDQRVSWMECHNLPTERMEVAVRLMAATSRRSRRTQLPVLQLSVSFAPGDPVDSAMIKRVLQRTLRDVGLGENQAILLEHHDTAVPHGHAIVNRVHPETGRAWKGSFSKTRIEASLRRQEQEEGLRVVPGWLAPVPGAPELRPRPRLARADQEFLRNVKERAGPVLKQAQSWSEVEAGLAELGLRVRVNGRGMSVTDGEQEVKASEIDEQVSRFKLEKQFGRYSDYRLRRTVASEIMGQAGTIAPGDAGRVRAAAAPPARQPAADLRERFTLYEEDGTFGVWDNVGPNVFFAETRERAEAELQRTNRLVARYPNIRIVRCLGDMDGEWRDARGLPRLPEEKGRPLRRRALPTQSEPSSPETTVDRARAVEPPSPVTPPPVQAPAKQQDATPTQRASFLSEVQEKARSVLRLADSWAELEDGLCELGLSLRVKGGGFVVTDGQREVKASKVGREFSRAYLEERLGRYPQPGVATPPAKIAPSFSAPATPPDAARQRQEPAASPTSAQIGLFEDLETIAPVVAAGGPEPSQSIKPVREEVEAGVDSLLSTPAPAGRTSEAAGGAALEPETALTSATDELVPLPVRNGSADAHAFLQLVELFRQSKALHNEVEKLDEAREKIAKWSGDLERATTDVKAATNDFAKQIQAAFRDPRAFSDLFKQLTEVQKRATLKTLREQPSEFAREFLALSGHERRNTGEQPRGWRARIGKAAERLWRTPPEQHVFRNPSGARGAGILTAGAGERYLNAVSVRDSVRQHVAGQLGFSDDVTLTEVRHELLTRKAAAEAQKAEALRLRETLKAPTVKELERAFLNLRPEDRQHVTRAVPAITSLIPKVLRLADGLVSGPERKSRGLDW